MISCQRNIQIAFKTSTVYYQPQAKLDVEGWKKKWQIIFYSVIIIPLSSVGEEERQGNTAPCFTREQTALFSKNQVQNTNSNCHI